MYLEELASGSPKNLSLRIICCILEKNTVKSIPLYNCCLQCCQVGGEPTTRVAGIIKSSLIAYIVCTRIFGVKQVVIVGDPGAISNFSILAHSHCAYKNFWC